jgi:hypothetical protein
MKTIACILLLTVSASAYAQPKTKKTLPNDYVAEFAIPLAKAKSYTRHFNNVAKICLKDSSNTEVTLRAFTVRVEDLLGVMGLSLQDPTVHPYVRAYLGLDSLTNEFHLLFIPAEGANIHNSKPGIDRVPNGSFKHGRVGPVQSGFYVLDFTSPCPPTCPEKSPLDPNKP